MVKHGKTHIIQQYPTCFSMSKESHSKPLASYRLISHLAPMGERKPEAMFHLLYHKGVKEEQGLLHETVIQATGLVVLRSCELSPSYSCQFVGMGRFSAVWL